MTNNLSLITNTKNRDSFTLIELLVVLALVAILSVVVVLTLNPAELIKQARDSNRLSDLSTINTALNLFSTDVTSGFMGTSTVVYVSIPSASPTCSGLGLPVLPSTYTYNCVTTANLRNTNGTGWIPVNFQRISSNSPISQLPIDPINTTSTRLYYTYVAGGSWELNASIEASKNKLGGSGDLVSKDGGSAASQYEIGNNLNLSPLETGDSSLVGYWNFEEGPNATSSDRSGYGNNGRWYGTSTQSEHYVFGKVGNYAGNFNGGSDYVSVSSSFSVPASNFSFSLWFYLNRTAMGRAFSEYIFNNLTLYQHAANNYLYLGGGARYISWQPTAGEWHHLSCAITSSGSSGGPDYQGVCYADGVVRSLMQAGYFLGTSGEYIGGNGSRLDGRIDDIRIYSRALSATEILALYNATK